MSSRPKYYVVWRGKAPGVYATWDECQQQVVGFSGAAYKSFATAAEAQRALAAGPPAWARRAERKAAMKADAPAAKDGADGTKNRDAAAAAKPIGAPAAAKSAPAAKSAVAKPARRHYRGLLNPPADRTDTVLPLPAEVRADALAVDAACSGNPGQMEYRGVDLRTGQVVFHFGPTFGTNNVGEFLAIVHALALVKQGGQRLAVYSDSRNALLWVRAGKCRTKLERTPRTAALYRLIERAEKWLAENAVSTPLLKWETRRWGEIPADFGRK